MSSLVASGLFVYAVDLRLMLGRSVYVVDRHPESIAELVWTFGRFAAWASNAWTGLAVWAINSTDLPRCNKMRDSTYYIVHKRNCVATRSSQLNRKPFGFLILRAPVSMPLSTGFLLAGLKIDARVARDLCVAHSSAGWFSERFI